MESNGAAVTKVLSVLAALYLLIMNLAQGVLFPYKFTSGLYGMFYEEVFTHKVHFLYIIMIIVPAVAVLLLIMSIVFSRINTKNEKINAAAPVYEIIGTAMLLIADAVYVLSFINKCALNPVWKEAWFFLIVNAYLAAALIFRIVALSRSKTKTGILAMIPGIIISSIVLVAFALLLGAMNSVRTGFENYRADLKKMDERFETDASNSLYSGVTIDDTVYAICEVPLFENDRSAKFVRIEKDGTLEVLDDGYLVQRCVAKYENTVFYGTYKPEAEYSFTIVSFDTETMTKDVFNANHVSEELRYLFGVYTRIIGIRDNYLYLINPEKYEVWRVKISDGLIDKQSLERYAWGVKEDELKVCYKNLESLEQWNWPWSWVRFENGDSDIEITLNRRKSSELGVDEGFSEVYLNDVSVVKKNQVAGTNMVTNAITVNIYNGEIYYAVIENGKLAFYKTDLGFNETVLLAQFDVDAAEAYREASSSTLVVSDSYLVFFNSKEYRIVSF